MLIQRPDVTVGIVFLGSNAVFFRLHSWLTLFPLDNSLFVAFDNKILSQNFESFFKCSLAQVKRFFFRFFLRAVFTIFFNYSHIFISCFLIFLELRMSLDGYSLRVEPNTQTNSSKFWKDHLNDADQPWTGRIFADESYLRRSKSGQSNQLKIFCNLNYLCETEQTDFPTTSGNLEVLCIKEEGMNLSCPFSVGQTLNGQNLKQFLGDCSDSGIFQYIHILQYPIEHMTRQICICQTIFLLLCIGYFSNRRNYIITIICYSSILLLF